MKEPNQLPLPLWARIGLTLVVQLVVWSCVFAVIYGIIRAVGALTQ